jgi:hypothetical protein
MKLLCKIGWHRWIYNLENFSVIGSFGNKTQKEYNTRTCNCGKKQYEIDSYEGKNWKTIQK